MARLIFLGSMHDDPAGKSKLQRAIQSLTSQYKTQPEFIAFEWAQPTYTALVPKRSELAKRMSAAGNKNGKTFSTRFADTLGFEPDLYQKLVPHPSPIWMLNGRCPDDINVPGSPSVEAFIDSKITNLTDWLLPRIQNWKYLSDEEMLDAAINVYGEESMRLASLTDPDSMQQELRFPSKVDRESYMFERLRNGLVALKKSDNLGVVIIGAAHLLDVPGSLLNCCLREEFVVERMWPHEQ